MRDAGRPSRPTPVAGRWRAAGARRAAGGRVRAGARAEPDTRRIADLSAYYGDTAGRQAAST